MDYSVILYMYKSQFRQEKNSAYAVTCIVLFYHIKLNLTEQEKKRCHSECVETHLEYHES